MSRYLRSNAPLFSPEDYSYILQCHDKKPRYKTINELMAKYKTSSKRIYQLWRGQECSINPMLNTQ
ncbi:9539_t:CDS:1, partial [Diversispora eburnea]